MSAENNLVEYTDDFKSYEPRLNQEWVQILINLRMKHSKAFTRKRHSATEAWKLIYTEMVELGAPAYLTIEKMKKKWMNLIARYKHLKFTVNNNNITWPYFDQIDRAFKRNPNILELRKGIKMEADSNGDLVHDYADYILRKQKFTSLLIQLRYTYRHLFTGKKFAAQRGWMVIQNMHPEGQLYSTDQLNKCWQNLVQRYKTVLEAEPDHSKIAWVHFAAMHEVMTQSGVEVKGVVKNEDVSTDECSNDVQIVEGTEKFHSKSDVFNDVDGIDANPSQHPCSPLANLLCHKRCMDLPTNKYNNNNTSGLDDLLKYLIQRDIKLDEQHAEMMCALKEIAAKLDKKEE